MSAGTTNTAQLLMLSGIGPRRHLEKFGVLLDIKIYCAYIYFSVYFYFISHQIYLSWYMSHILQLIYFYRAKFCQTFYSCSLSGAIQYTNNFRAMLHQCIVLTVIFLKLLFEIIHLKKQSFINFPYRFIVGESVRFKYF